MLTTKHVNSMTSYEKALYLGYFLNDFDQDAERAKLYLKENENDKMSHWSYKSVTTLN